MHNINVVPRRKLFRYLCMRVFIGGAQVGKRLTRENNAPPERIVWSIALINPNLMSRVGLLHQDRKIQPRRSPTNDVDLHQFDFPQTPKAFANFSPGLERSDNPGSYEKPKARNPEKGSSRGEPFSRVQITRWTTYPGLS